MRVTQRLFNTLAFTAVAALVAIVPTNILANPLPVNPDGGILSIGPFSGSLVGVTSGANNCISWVGLPGPCVAGTTHPVSVNGSSSSFALGSAGNLITDVVGLPFPGNPPGNPIISKFMTLGGGTFVGSVPVFFDLTKIFVNSGATVGTCSDAAFASCTPANSPFTFAEDSQGTTVKISFSVLYDVYTGTIGTGVTKYQGGFETTLTGNQPNNVNNGVCAGVADKIVELLTCAAAGGTITASWSGSGSPVNTTPEPFTFVLFGSGLVGVAIFGRRFRRRS